MVSDQILVIETIFSFMMGCCFGSFINVIIYRLPHGQSILVPRSYCVKCKHRISFLENIPLVSWVFLRAKCRYCRQRISVIYPLLELICGFLFVISNYSEPSIFAINSKYIITILGWIFFSLLLPLAILDIKYFWLPESICKIGIISGILSSVIIETLYISSSKYLITLSSIIAALLGYIVFQLISEIGLRVFHKPAMGKGDSKLTALIGSWLGIKGTFITIWLAFNLAGIFVIIGLISKRIKRNQKIPFGTFLVLSGMSVWHFGNDAFTQIMYFGK